MIIEKEQKSMFFTDEQQAILNGSQGETIAKVWKNLVMYGEAFHTTNDKGEMQWRICDELTGFWLP